MALSGSKGPLASLTINASLIGVALAILNVFNIHIAPAAMPELDDIIKGAAAAIAIYGRIRAKQLVIV